MNHIKPSAWRMMAVIAATGLWLGAAASSDLDDPTPSSAVASAPARQAPSVHATPQAATNPASRVVPESLLIPSLDMDRSLIDLGLTPSGELEVPTMAQADQPGWYKYSVAPGEKGPAVIAGHVDSKTGPAVFFELHSLRVGDAVHVERSDGKTAIFAVTKISSHDKDRFPTNAVYGPVTGRELRLITCGGEFQQEQGSYEQNLVVFAKLRKLVPTPG